MSVLRVTWSSAATQIAPDTQFALAIRAVYAFALRRGQSTTRDCELTLSAPDIRARWGVAPRRMLHRVLLGLGAQGLKPDPLDRLHCGGSIPTYGAPSRRRSEAAHSAPAPTGVPGTGTWGPGKVVLLVGDRPGAGWSGRLNWPFISGHRGGCSAWLCEQLEAGGISEQRLYWINAHTQNGAETTSTFVETLRPVAVVALGRHAAEWCSRLTGVLRVEVHHPQYWKRFHSGHKYHLVKVLRAIFKEAP